MSKMRKHESRSTLLNLVCAVQDYATSDDEVVAIITHLLNTGRVVLSGTFAGQQTCGRRPFGGSAPRWVAPLSQRLLVDALAS
jgi:hypothetical protein